MFETIGAMFSNKPARPIAQRAFDAASGGRRQRGRKPKSP